MPSIVSIVNASGGSVTIPSGANAFVMAGTYFDGNASQVVTALTGSRITTQTVRAVGSTDFMGAYLVWGVCNSTGADTWTLTKAGFYLEGPTSQIAFLTVENTSDFIRDDECVGNVGGIISRTLDSTTTDIALAWIGSDGGGNVSGAISGWTAQGTEQTVNADKSRVFLANSPGASTTSINGPANDYPTLSAVTIKGTGGGTQTLTPSLFTNTSTFYSPTVSQAPSGQVLQPSLYTNSQSFYGPTVSGMPDGARGQWIVDNTGPIGGAPAGILYNDVELPGDADKWFHFVITTPPATGTLDILPDGRFTFIGPNPETMYYQLYVDNVAVGSPQLVELYSESQNLLPSLLTNSQSFFAPTVVVSGSVTVLPSLVTNSSTFFSPTVRAGVILQPSLFTNTPVIYLPTVSATGAVLVSPPLLTNSSTIFAPRVVDSSGPTTPSEQKQRIGLKLGIGL